MNTDMKKKVQGYGAAVPAGVDFASQADFKAFCEVLSGKLLPSGRLPAVVITGPHGCGKSRLGRAIVEYFGMRWSVVSRPKSGDGFVKVLNALALPEKGCFAVFDDVWGDFERSRDLLCFIGSSDWTFRKLGTQQVVTVRNDVRVMLIGTDLRVPEDFKRRCLVIRLAEC